MESTFLLIAHWLVSNVGLPVLNAGIERLLIQMGIKDSPPSSRNQILIKEYILQLEKDIRQVKATLDEDRLAKLRAALVQVSESQKTVARREYLTNALNNFYVIVNYPEHGFIGNYTNAQLRCVAFVGMAAAHTALHDSRSLVAEKIIEAIYADVDTARAWLGEQLVNQVLSLFPLPVNKGLLPFVPVVSQTSRLILKDHQQI